MKEEIEIKVESVISELQEMRLKYFYKLDELKQKCKKYLNRKAEKAKRESKYYENYINYINQLHKDKYKNIGEIRHNLSKLDEFIDEIGSLRNEIRDELFKKITYEPSKYAVGEELIGKIDSELIIGEIVSKEIPKCVELNKSIRMPTSICSIGDKALLLSDRKTSKIYRLNDKFQLCQEISEIGLTKLNKPTSICTDEIENVFVCNSNNTEILIIDIGLKKLKNMITNENKNDRLREDFDYIKDISYYNERLYVLDANTSIIQVFNTNGNFNKKFLLNKTDCERLNNPTCMAIIDNTIAIVDDARKTYFFDLNDGSLKGSLLIENIGYIKSICFASNYLFLHAVDGTFVCYEINEDNDKQEHTIKLCFRREIEDLRETSESMIYFNKQIIVSLTYERQLVAF